MSPGLCVVHPPIDGGGILTNQGRALWELSHLSTSVSILLDLLPAELGLVAEKYRAINRLLDAQSDLEVLVQFPVNVDLVVHTWCVPI